MWQTRTVVVSGGALLLIPLRPINHSWPPLQARLCGRNSSVLLKQLLTKRLRRVTRRARETKHGLITLGASKRCSARDLGPGRLVCSKIRTVPKLFDLTLNLC